MRRFGSAIIAAVILVGLSVSIAFATAKFKELGAQATNGNLRQPGSTTPTIHGGLYVNFKETGLGNPETCYEVCADAKVHYVCIYEGGSSARTTRNLTTVGCFVKVSATFKTDKNGNVVGAIAVAPPPAGIPCSEGALEIADVTYKNVKITDLTRNVSEDIPGTFSRTFITPDPD